jgi:hypothetical protein
VDKMEEERGGNKPGRKGPNPISGGKADMRSRPRLEFSPEGNRLFVYSGLGAIRDHPSFAVVTRPPNGEAVVLNAETGKPLPALQDTGYISYPGERQTFSADGRLLALSGQNYQLLTAEQAEEIQREDRSFIGARLLTGDPRVFTTVWDTDTGKVVKRWEASSSVAFSQARPVLAVVEQNGQDSRLGYWDFSAEKK